MLKGQDPTVEPEEDINQLQEMANGWKQGEGPATEHSRAKSICWGNDRRNKNKIFCELYSWYYLAFQSLYLDFSFLISLRFFVLS